MQIRNSFHNNMNNRVNEGPNLRTYNLNQGNRSPLVDYSYNMRRSPQRVYDQGTSELGYGEMKYYEPNEFNFGRSQNMSPLNDSSNLRSPMNPNYNNEYTKVINLAGNNKVPMNQREISELERRKRFSRSPNLLNNIDINRDNEMNFRTLNRNNINYMRSPQTNYDAERSYNMISNERANIFLDQPVQQDIQHIQQNEELNFSNGFIQEGQNYFEQNSREIQYNMNPRDLQEQQNEIYKKMSPKSNVEGDSDTNSEKNDNVKRIRDLKNQLEKNNTVVNHNDDGFNEINRQTRGDIQNLEMMAKAREFQDNTRSEDVKKLIKFYVKTYDPKKGEDGNLISNCQTIIQPNQEQFFNNRYQVIQKMNKLSTILLAKNRSRSPLASPINKNDENIKNKFDIRTLNNATLNRSKKTLRTNKHNKFLYVTLALLSAKGPNAENRTIFRKNRMEKGGVVDLAQETIQKKNKFKITKVKATGRGTIVINPKYREKAAKIVQGWWRERKARYDKTLKQIIKIQSAWRGKFFRKYIYEIIFLSFINEKFFEIMRKVLVNNVRPYVFNELFSKNKLIKDTFGGLLTKYDRKFTLLRLKPYFLKWKNSSECLSQRIVNCKDLFDKKVDNENKLNIMKKYFDKWALLSNLYKYIGKAKNAEEKRNKFFGTLNMINGLTNLTKRKVYNTTKKPIEDKLKELLRNKLMNKLIKTIGKKSNELQLRNKLNRWRIAVKSKEIIDLKADTFIKSVNHMDWRMYKMKMKYYLDKWRNQIPRAKKILDINKGTQLLNRFVLRKNFNDPLNAFLEKYDNLSKKESTLKFLILKRRNLRNNLRDLFTKWKNKNIRLEDKDKRNELYKTLLKNIINKIEKRILYKRFNQWRKRPKVNINDEMKKIVDFTNILNKIFRNSYLEEYKKFLEQLDKTRDEHCINNAGKNIFKAYKGKGKSELRFYFNKWRNQIKDESIKKLNLNLLKFAVNSIETKSIRNLLSKYLTRWRLFIEDKKNSDYLDKLKKVNKAGDILSNIFHKRIRDFIIRLYRKMGKDYRPIILFKVLKQIESPRASIRECFDKWRRIVNNEQSKENINNFKAKIMEINVRGVKNRNNRDKFIKAFFWWRAMSKKPEEYYPRLNNLLNILAKNIKKSGTKEPFDKIKDSRNPERYLLKVINNYKNQEKRRLNNLFISLFGRWKKAISDSNIKDLKTKIIYNFKFYQNEGQKKKLLSKYLTKWRLNSRKKGIDINFTKGIDKLTELFKSKSRKTIHDIYMNKIKEVLKNKYANNIFKAADKTKNNVLHNAFLKWWRNAMNIDPNRMTKIKTRLRRIIKYSDIEPKVRTFRKWAKKALYMKLREKDFEIAMKTINMAIRNHNKKLVNNAMSTWKKRIQYLREEYLRGLIFKQMAITKNVKEQMNNKARLRSALLKWRAKLVPVDYLNRLKQIKKGCKKFKLSLKKLHEKDLFDNIKEKAKENRKKYLLNNFLTKLIPELANYQMKRAMDIWKSKLGDTQKMKIKIKNIFEDYVYSDKVHNGLFKDPKERIIELFNNYSNKKKEAADKIAKFIKNVSKIPEYINKCKAVLLLNKLVMDKEKQINEIKKMQFIRFYRQTQKIKNDDNSKIIQKFVKDRLRKYFNKQKNITKGISKISLLLKKLILNKVKNSSVQNCLHKLLSKYNDKAKQNNENILKNKLNQWKDICDNLKKYDNILKIQGFLRTCLAKKKLDNLKKRNELLLKIHSKYEGKENALLNKNLHDWLHKALMIKNNENANVIQNFCKMKLLSLKKKAAKNKLENIFKKYTKHKLALIMEKSSRIIGGKGEVIYKMLQDILYRKPFDKFINNLKFEGKINTLRNIQPKIHNKISNYQLSKALKKWKENTYDKTIKYTILLQKFLREQYNKKLQRDKEKREYLLKQFIIKLMKNNLYKLQLPFNIWNKKSKLEKVNEGVKKIQIQFRKYLERQKEKDKKAAETYVKLVKCLKTKMLLDILQKIKDDKNRNDGIKKLLKIILIRKIKSSEKANLGNSFNKWRNINKIMNDLAKRIQTAFRAYISREKKNRIIRINILLKKYLLKQEKCNGNNLRTKLRKWNNKMKFMKYNEKSNIIQNFIRPKLYKLLNDKIKNFFYSKGKKKVYRFLLLSGKINKLQNALFRPNLSKFMNNLKVISDNQNKKEKLNNTVNKVNERNKYIIMKKYLIKWSDNNRKLKEKRNNSAQKIQRAFREYKERKEKNRLLNLQS